MSTLALPGTSGPLGLPHPFTCFWGVSPAKSVGPGVFGLRRLLQVLYAVVRWVLVQPGPHLRFFYGLPQSYVPVLDWRKRGNKSPVPFPPSARV